MSNSENWSFYNYLGGHSGSAFPTTVRNPNKAICTINAKTSEVGLLHWINFDIGILLNFIFKLARHEDKCNFFACAVLLKDHIIVIRFLYVNLLILFGRIHTFCKRMLKIVLRLPQKLEGQIIYHIWYLKKNFQSEFCLNWNTFEINIICLRFIQVKLTKISYIGT